MSKTRSVGPLVVAGVVMGAMAGPSFVSKPSGGAASVLSQGHNPPGATPRAQAHTDDDALDTLDTIGESLGVDLSTEGLRRRASRAVETLGGPDASKEPDRQNALVLLRSLFQLNIRPSGNLEPARAALSALESTDRPDAAAEHVETLRRFMAGYFNQDALTVSQAGVATDPTAFLLARDFDQIDKTALKITVLRLAARAQQVTFRFLIATLPDPIDSFTGWQFDPMLDAISQAVAASEYLLERFHFPDSDKEEDSGSAAGERGRVHELEPGVLVYKRHKDDPRATGSERLLLLVVHENPAAGVHVRALANAMRLVLDCASLTSDPNGEPILLLGPTFSGSAETLARAVRRIGRRLGAHQVRVVSGSATDLANKKVIQEALCSGEPDSLKCRRDVVPFHATVHPDTVLLPALVSKIAEAGAGRRVATLFEANSSTAERCWRVSSGQNGTQTRVRHTTSSNCRFQSTCRGCERLWTRRIPSHPRPFGLPSRFRPLAMEAQGNPVDQIPQFNPKTTATYVELALARMLEDIDLEGVKKVMLLATDPRDNCSSPSRSHGMRRRCRSSRPRATPCTSTPTTRTTCAARSWHPPIRSCARGSAGVPPQQAIGYAGSSRMAAPKGLTTPRSRCWSRRQWASARRSCPGTPRVRSAGRALPPVLSPAHVDQRGRPLELVARPPRQGAELRRPRVQSRRAGRIDAGFGSELVVRPPPRRTELRRVRVQSRRAGRIDAGFGSDRPDGARRRARSTCSSPCWPSRSRRGRDRTHRSRRPVGFRSRRIPGRGTRPKACTPSGVHRGAAGHANVHLASRVHAGRCPKEHGVGPASGSPLRSLRALAGWHDRRAD